MSPVVILAVGMATVLGLIVVGRVHAFLALLAAALAVSLLADGLTGPAVARVAEAFGATAASIGIVIAFAAVIGSAMTTSGAADRVVRAFTGDDHPERAAPALAASGAVLAIPVFFDTVFYLLIPLARSAARASGRGYLKLLLAVAGGAAISHTLVPPTPGPLVTAAELGVDLGTMMGVGLVIAVPCTAAVLLFAGWAERRMPQIPPAGPQPEAPASEPPPGEAVALPSLGLALLPVVLPVALIGAATVATALDQSLPVLAALGNPNLALGLAAVAALAVQVRQRGTDRRALAASVEAALMAAGVIILITAAGGAFGAMLRAAGVGEVVAGLVGDGAGGVSLLALAFGTASLIKTAQGSSTVAMITTVGLVSGAVAGVDLPFHAVYLATAIASGSLVGSWMNDSGFWIFATMGGLGEVETLKTWTPLLALVGLVAFATTLLLAGLVPMV
ncbi:GntP family permease [Rubrivirga sp. IMCC45206]|uniref:GntP family permease n=1 Tax=Rubrivirga sp. IMCC45206 TaxID=3391614 RepID=UPI00398FD782